MQYARCEVRGARCEVRGARCEVRYARCDMRGRPRKVGQLLPGWKRYNHLPLLYFSRSTFVKLVSFMKAIFSNLHLSLSFYISSALPISYNLPYKLARCPALTSMATTLARQLL